jgi:hypothetical protein
MRDESDELSELEEYRQKVVEEVLRRGEVVKNCEAELASADHMVYSTENQTVVPLGNTVKLQQREAYKATLKRKRDLSAEKRRVARADLEKAEQRLAEVDARIRELSKGGLGVLERVSEGDASE